MDKPKRNSPCFELTPSGYEEITYEELCRRAKADPDRYKDKEFLFLHGMLMEVTPEDSRLFKRAADRMNYLLRLDRAHHAVSFEMTVENNSHDIPVSKDDVAAAATTAILIENMHRCITLLSPDEQFLINSLFFQSMSERELSSKTGIPQRTINYRKKNILKKLKKLMKL